MTAARSARRPIAATAAGAATALLALTACASGTASSAPSVTTAPSSSATSTSASPSESPSPSGSDTASTSPTSSATASTSAPAGSFEDAPVSGGTSYSAPSQAHLQRIAVGSHTGYDRLVLYFGTDAVPPFTVTPQESASFKADPSDETVTLAGTSGVRVVVRDTVRAPTTTENLLPRFPAIRQVRGIGDFEAVVSYAVGTAGTSPRIRVTTLTAPSRLVIDVAWPDPA